MGEGIFREGGIWGRENLGEVDNMEAKHHGIWKWRYIYTNVIYGETTLYMKTMFINMETACYIWRKHENNAYKYGDNMLYM